MGSVMDMLFWVAAAAMASLAIVLVWEWRSRDRSSNREAARVQPVLEISDRADVGASRSSSSNVDG
jgi:hypothetical protein